jgi:glycosyltransferase involved in cell wall biosynthesis
MKQSSLAVVILHKDQIAELEELVQVIPNWVSEIIIIDDCSGVELPEFSDPRVQIYTHRLQADYADQRNFALQQVMSAWTLFLDVDEVPSTTFFQQIRRTIADPGGDFDAYTIVRHQVFLGKVLQHGDGGSQEIIRLGKTEKGFGLWQRRVHEVWQFPVAKVGKLSGEIKHYNAISVSHFLSKLQNYAQLEPETRERYSLLRVITELALYPAGKFTYNYLFKLGFLDGWPGFVHAWLMSYYSAIVRVFLYEYSLSH